jgi:hypothetical protein
MASVDMTTAPDAITKARAAGYSDDEIYNYLSQRAPEQFKQAKDAGYSSSEVLNHLGGKPPEKPMGWGDVASEAAVNLIPSTGRLIGDVAHAGFHPIETAKNLKNVGLGLAEQTGLTGSVLPPTGGGHEQYAKALEQYFIDRYGFGEKGIQGFKEAFAKDPASFLADIASLASGGEGILARVPGLAKAAEAVGTAGRVVDPLTNVGRAAGLGGKVLAEGLGVTTGVGSTPLKVAYEAGQEGGEAGKAFRQNLMGKAPKEAVIDDAKTALGNLRQQRGIEYNQGMAHVKGDQTVLKFDDIDNALTKISQTQTFKDRPRIPEIQQAIGQKIAEWKNLPSDYHTPEGFDAMKQEIGIIRDKTAEGTAERYVADQAYNAIKKTIVDQSPGYANTMENYSKANKLIDDIKRTFSTGEKASRDTALRKLQSVMRNNVQTNYGRRTDLAKMLAANGAPQLMEKLAGQALSSPVPRGLAKFAASGVEGAVPALTAAKAGLAAGGLAAAKIAPMLAFTSPLLMGGAAHGLGIASRYLPLSTLPGRVTRIPTAAERMYGPR